MRRASLLTAGLVAGLACGGGTAGPDDAPDPAQITVSPDSVDLVQFGAQALTVTVRDGDGATIPNLTPTFASSDSAIVGITSAGLVSSIGPRGTAAITVMAGGLSTQLPVVVRPVPATLTVTPESLTIVQKDSAQLTVAVLDAVGVPLVDSPITYSSNPGAIVTVRPAGVVVALGPALPTQLQVRVGSQIRAVPIRILQRPAAIAVTPEGVSQVPLQGTLQFSASVVDLNGDPMPGAIPAWSTDTSLAQVSGSGLLTAGGLPGRVAVTAVHTDPTYGDVTGSATVFLTQTVLPAAQAPGNLVSLNVGGTPVGVAISPGGQVIAVGLGDASGAGGIWETAVSTFNAADTLVLGGEQFGVAMNAAGTRAFVVAGAIPGPSPGIGVIDLQTSAQIAYMEHGLFGRVFSVGLSNDEQRVVMGTETGTLVIFDVATGAWRTTLTHPGGLFRHIATHPTLPRMYASSFGAGFLNPPVVVEIDLVTEILRVLPITTGKAQGVAVSGDGAHLFIADENGPLQIWDIAGDRLEGTIPVAEFGFGLTLSPDGQTLLQVGGRVLVIDVASRVVTAVYNFLDARSGAVSADGTVMVVTGPGGFLSRFAP